MKCLVLAAAIIVAAAAPAHAVQLIANGDFSQAESLTLPRTPALVVQTPTGWASYRTATGTISPNLPISGGGNSVFYPAEVTSVNVNGAGVSSALWLNTGDDVGPFSETNKQGGGVSQTFTTVAGAYSFSADVAAWTVQNGAQGGIFSVILDNVVLGSFDFGPVSASAAGTIVNRHSFAFTGSLAAGSHTLKLEVLRPFGPSLGRHAQYWDNVSLDLAAVPEPASWMMMIGGLGLAGMAVRRRKATLRYS